MAKLRTNIVFGEGNLNASLAIIADAPGKYEDLSGTPLIGEGGDKLDKLLASLGISRSEIWITNVCMCRPKSPKPNKTNRVLSAKEMRECLPRLVKELDIIKPKIIVLAGNAPLYLATGKRGITKHRGWQDMKWKGEGFTVERIYATLHPASILHGSTEQIKQKRQWLWNDWQQIARTLSVIKKEEVAEKG